VAPDRHRAHRGPACAGPGRWRTSRSSASDGDGGRAPRRHSGCRHRAAAGAAGKSLRFATLPEGQDPDDLWRSGGREAIDAVLSAARHALPTCCGLRETEAATFTTPERRAALEARIVRNHRHDRRRDRAQVIIGAISATRLRKLFFGPTSGRGRDTGPDNHRAAAPNTRMALERTRYRKAGPQCKDAADCYSSFATRPGRRHLRCRETAAGCKPDHAWPPAPPFPRREALILQAATQPSLGLLYEHLEALEGTEFVTPDVREGEGRADRHQSDSSRRPRAAPPMARSVRGEL